MAAVTIGSSVAISSVTVTKPSGVVNGSVLVIRYHWFKAGDQHLNNATCSDSFVDVGSLSFFDAGESYSFGVSFFRKVITNAAGEPSTYTITPPGGSGTDVDLGLIVRLVNCDTTTPETDAGQNSTGFATTSTFTTGAAIDAGANDLLLLGVTAWTLPVSTPSGMMQDYLIDGGDIAGFSENPGVLSGGTRSGTTGGNDGWAVAFVVFKAATGGGGTPDTYQGPLVGSGSIIGKQRTTAATARLAQQMLFHLPQDVSVAPPAVVAPYVPDVPGQGVAFRESKADYINRALYSTVTLWGGGGDVQFLPPDTWTQPIQGERAILAAQSAFQQRSRLASTLLWPVPNDQPPAIVVSPPYQAPLVGERALANALRQQALRAQLATSLLIFSPIDNSTVLAQPDTYQPPIVGVGALQASRRAFSARSTQSNSLLWPVPQNPPFAPVTIPPLAGEGLWAKALQRQATQSRLATSLLIFSPSDTGGLLNVPDTYQPPIIGQGVYAAQQRLYRLGADRANRLLWTAPQTISVLGTQPDTYQPPLAGDGVYRRVISENRRRAALASSLLFVGNRDPFVAQAFKPEWAIRAHTTIGFTIEPR